MRSRRTQLGVLLDPAKSRVVVPPTDVRRWNRYPFAAVGVRNMKAFGALAAVPSRNMTPALAKPLVFSRDTTRALMVTSPVTST